MTVAEENSPLLRDERTQPTQTYGTNGSLDAVDANDDGNYKPQLSMAAVIVPISIGIFLSAMDGTIIASSYAKIGSELNQLQNTSWIATGYMLTLTSFQPLYGKMSDIFGRKACLVFAYTVFALGCLLCGLARNMTELVAARALAGIGGGGMTTVASIVMSDIAPLRQRGTWQGIANMVFATGQAVGAPLGGYFADTIGWRWAFLMQVPLAFLAIFAVSLALKITHTHQDNLTGRLKRVDFLGAVTLVSAIFCLLLGLDRGGNVSWSDTITIGCLSAFIVLFFIFVFVELRVANEPFAPKRIITDHTLIASYLANFFSLGAAMTMVFQTTLYFQAVHNKSAAEAGLVLLPSILASVMGSLFGGIIMQSSGKYYWLTVCSFVSMITGQILVPGFAGTWTYSYGGLTVGLCLSSLGVGAAITTTLIALIANAGPEDQAVATAVSYLFRSLGSVVWLSIGTSIVQDNLRKLLHQRLTGEDVDEIIRKVRQSLTYIHELEPVVRVKVRASYDEAIHVAFWFGVGLTACALLASFFIKEKPLTK